MGDGLLRIGEAAAAAGVSTRTLRYYEERGLLSPTGHTAGGERRYSDDDVARLVHIRELADLLGTDLEQIRAALAAEDEMALLRDEFHRPGQTLQRQLELVDRAEELNAALQATVAERLQRLERVRDDLQAKAARYRRRRRQLQAEVGPAGTPPGR